MVVQKRTDPYIGAATVDLEAKMIGSPIVGGGRVLTQNETGNTISEVVLTCMQHTASSFSVSTSSIGASESHVRKTLTTPLHTNNNGNSRRPKEQGDYKHACIPSDGPDQHQPQPQPHNPISTSTTSNISCSPSLSNSSSVPPPHPTESFAQYCCTHIDDIRRGGD